MFRYIALAWDDAEPTSSDTARHLGLDWQARPDWVAAVLRPGLQVFTTGTKLGVNDTYPLQAGMGVVLGKLFRRSQLGSLPAQKVLLDSKDADNIIDTGGRALVRDFWGRYVAFLQMACGSTCVLRDPSGTLPCFRIRQDGVSIVFSWLEDARSAM